MKNLFKLQILYKANFEVKGLYISYKLFKLKKKILLKKKPVEFLTTSRYVIPLPSEEETSKPKIWRRALLHSILPNIYDFYQTYISEQKGFFYSSFYSIYNPDKLSTLNRFDYQIKFDILRILKNSYWLTTEFSFFKLSTKTYFNSKNFKLFSLLYFWDMFIKYRNPNLPLLWKRGENFTPKIEGRSLLKIREILFWELVFEHLGKNYFYSAQELKMFKLAGINTMDPRYYWPTWKLFLLNLSDHDGRIAPATQTTFFWTFSDIPTVELKNNVLFPLKKKLLAQFLHWREIFLKLAFEGKIMYDISNYNSSLQQIFYKFVNPRTNVIDIMHKNQISIQNYIFAKITLDKKFSYLYFPTPTHYFGFEDTFFLKNFLLPNSNLQDYKNAPYLKFLDRLEISNFLHNLSLVTNKNKTNEYHFLKSKMVFFNIKNTQKPVFTEAKFITPPSSKFFENLKYQTPEITINSMCSKPNAFTQHTSNLREEAFFPIPEFLKIFIFLFFQPNITPEDINLICVEPFLHLLPEFKLAKTLALKEVDNFLGELQVYKSYFDLATKYDLRDPTIAYKILKEVLQTMPNKDFSVFRLEPYGLNPFYKFTQILTNKDVPFPASISNYNHFHVLRKEFYSKNSFLYKFRNLFLHNYQKIFFSCLYKKSFNSLNFLFSNYLKNIFFTSTNPTFNLWFFIKKNHKNSNFIWFCLKFWITLPLFFKNTNWNWFLNTLKQQYLSMKINDIEDTTDLEFLQLNAYSSQNYSPEEAELLFLKRVKKFWTDLFLKNYEKQRSFSFINIMFKLLWTIKSFNWIFSINSLLVTNKLLQFNYFFYSKNYQIFNFFLYESNFLNFLKIFFLTKFFFYNYKILLK